MALHLVIVAHKNKQRVLLATSNAAYAKTKFDLESLKLKDGTISHIKVARYAVINSAVARSVAR